MNGVGHPEGDEGDAIAAAPRTLRAGRIVAVKGLGGYHLACDAASAVAVARLRARKQRDEKPFAVMVRDLEAARALARLDAAEEALLASASAPSCWCGDGPPPASPPSRTRQPARRPDARLHAAPPPPARGRRAAAGDDLGQPVGRADGVKDAEALARLGGIADLFLTHDRAIENRCDDSVARVIAGRPTVFRRSRGYVPRAVRLRLSVRRPVLACGAHLKNTFCLAAGDEAWLGPHVGDLDNLEAAPAFEEPVERLQRFVGIRPEVIAHDLHPDYFSTRYALARPEASKVAVQHHHAHVASAMAEHGLEGPVLGLACDGTGYGADGTAWGGELLLVRDAAPSERLATLRPLPLAGGDLAIRDVWRIALAALDDAFDGAPPLERLRLFDAVPARDVAVVRQMIATGRPLAARPRRRPLLRRDRAPRPRAAAGELRRAGRPRVEPGRGRVRDGVLPVRPRRETAASPRRDLRPIVRAAVGDLSAGLARTGLGPLPRQHGRRRGGARASGRGRARALPVVLTGGCFQNARLAESVLAPPRARLRRAPPRRGSAQRRRDRARPGAGGGRGRRAMMATGGVAAMCLAVPGRSSRSRATATCAWGRSTSAASRARPASPTCPRSSSATTCWSTSASRSRASTRRRRRRRSTPSPRSERSTRSRLAEALMRHLDEYRDPAAVGAVVAPHPRDGHPALDAHGGLRRADPLHPEVRPRRAAAAERCALIHGPGCPVCVTPLEHDRPRARHRGAARRHLLLLRRHAARARLDATTC